MLRAHTPYPVGFKGEVVRLVCSRDELIRAFVADLWVSSEALSHSLQQDDAGVGRRSPASWRVTNGRERATYVARTGCCNRSARSWK
jgi:hypothetical protein